MTTPGTCEAPSTARLDSDWTSVGKAFEHEDFSCGSLGYTGPSQCDFPATARAFRNMRLMHLLERIASKFNRAGIPLMVLKGAALNLSLYGSPSARAMDDLDLAIRPEHIDDARALLEELGGLRGEPQVREDFFPRFHYEMEYSIGTVYPVKVDLHVRPFRPLRYSRTVPPEAFWDDAVTVRIGNASVLHPSPEDMLIHLAAHSAVHGNSRKKWLEDIRLWTEARGPQINWNNVVAKLDHWRLALPFQRAIAATETRSAPVCPPDVRRALEVLAGNWRDRLALDQAPRDASHPATHVVVNAICTPGWRFVLGYLWAVAVPDRAHMADWYCRRHWGWLPSAHLLRWLGPVARCLPRPLRWFSNIEIQKSRIHGVGVFATRNIAPDVAFARFRGRKVDREGPYVVWSENASGQKQRYEIVGKLKYLNHSCRPNARFAGFSLVALRPIQADEEITIEYEGATCNCRDEFRIQDS